MRTPLLATLVVTAVLAAIAPPVANGATAATRPDTWSTDARVVERAPAPTPEVTGIRVGHHRRFDRVVLDLTGPAPGFRVRYVRQLRADGSGNVIDLRGPVSLRIVLTPANGHDPDTGQSTLTTPSRTAWRLDQLRETAVIGDFEAVFTLGVGLRHKSAFRVLTLQDPTRIVVDIRH